MLIKQKHLFKKEECDIILNLYNDIPQKWNLSDRNYISNSIKYSYKTSWLFDKLKTFVEKETDIQIQTFKTHIHFHTFKNGDWFGKHNDTRDTRGYGVGVLLNDNFEGGDFKLYNKNEIILDKLAGNTYLFDVRIEHEITPILVGERYSLLWFLKNENIKYKTNKLL